MRVTWQRKSITNNGDVGFVIDSGTFQYTTRDIVVRVLLWWGVLRITFTRRPHPNWNPYANHDGCENKLRQHQHHISSFCGISAVMFDGMKEPPAVSPIGRTVCANPASPMMLCSTSTTRAAIVVVT
jgi:hypothetical protein